MILGNTACYAYTEIQSKNINLNALEKAWNQLIQQHEMLHTSINEDMTQNILKKIPYYKIEQNDISHLNKKDIETYLQTQRKNKLSKVLNPKQWPLILIDAYVLPNKEIRVCIYLDMLICDASSMFILLKDLKYLYMNTNEKLPALQISFKDYLAYEQNYIRTEEYKKSLDYWKKRLDTLPQGPDLALAVNPESIKTPKFSRHSFTLAS